MSVLILVGFQLKKEGLSDDGELLALAMLWISGFIYIEI